MELGTITPVTKIQTLMKNIHGKPVIVEAIIKSTLVPALVDLGCTIYSVFSRNIVDRLNLPRTKVPPKELRLAKESDKNNQIVVDEICWTDIDLDGKREQIYGYIIEGLAHNVILGEPWMRCNDVVYRARERILYLGKDQHYVRTHDSIVPTKDINMLRYTEFSAYVKRAYQRNKVDKEQDQSPSIYAASIHDINKMLSPKKQLSREKIMDNLPEQLRHYHSLFEANHNDLRDLPPHRQGVDLSIEIEKDEQGRTKDLPKGPLYNMSRDELLCLRKEITELLDRNWIRASSSLGGAPVLFVKKPGGGLRFCVDYRSLNAITKNDRYPLPLIKETFSSIAKARWLTKLDVSAAFHRIRIKEGDEWKTAFQTRLGLFEWLVTPFGLTGAPAAWQRWINHLLRDYLDVFCTAYLDDILV